jgi:hypothetical protein
VIDIETIEMFYRQRQSELGPLLSRWADVARHAEGKIVVPVSELDEDEKSMAVNLLGPGLDQLAMRVASTMPDISVDPLKPGIKDSENKAAVKRRAMLSWWDMNRMDMILRRRARFLLGYAASPVSISFMGMNPLDKRDIPHWRVLNPMCVFPAKTVDINDIEPPDCIHAFLQPLSWLQSLYPTQAGILYKGKANASTMFEILEYNDCDETVLVALGQAREPNQGPSWERTTTVSVGTQSVVELARVVNKAGIPLTVYPGRITIAGLQGMFDQLMPVYHNASKLAALEYIAIKQSIFPKEWLVSHPNSPGQAEVIVEADGLTGVMGEIRNGQIQQTQVQPSIQASQMQDRLERVGRLAGGLPAELGGESATNIRTARRGEAVLGSAIDMPVQEHQEIFEDSMEAENHRAIAVMKAYFGSKPTSFYIPKNGKITKPDYTPNDVFENDQNVCKYGMTGTDANSFVIAMGQRLQMETISPETFMEMDPVVEDVHEEMGRIWISGARRAMMSSVENQASQGTIDPTFIARFAQALQDGKTQPEDALTTVHKEMQKEQAAQQASQPQAAPGGAPQPGQMPGMTGAPGVQGGVPMPPPGQGALSQILGNLRKPAAQGGSEQAMAQQAPSPLAQ